MHAVEDVRPVTDPGPVRLAHRTITWTLEQERRGMRLFLIHAGFDPDGPARTRARKIMGEGW